MVFFFFLEFIYYSDLVRTTPPFKDYMNNMHTYAYLQNLEIDPSCLQPRHSQITQQYSSSTDEGCECDHGGRFCWKFFFCLLDNPLNLDDFYLLDSLQFFIRCTFFY